MLTPTGMRVSAGVPIRTLPSDGKFTPESAAVYQAVLDAQHAGIALAKPGSTLNAIEHAARRTLAKRLVELGVIKDPNVADRLQIGRAHV